MENIRVKALYDYSGRNDNELSFKKGQTIFLVRSDGGWSSGECLGKSGWFPTSYVTPDTALAEIAATEEDSHSKNVETKSLLLQRELTALALNEFIPHRPEKSDLEKKKILTEDKDGKKTKKDEKKEDKKEKIKKSHKEDKDKKDKDKDAKSGFFGFGSTKKKKGGKDDEQKTVKYFGVPLPMLPEVCDINNPRQLPWLVERCISFIRTSALDLQGIFRVSGLASDVDKLQKQFEAGDFQTDFVSQDPHAVAGVLKKFFRELPEPLFTYELHKQFMEVPLGIKIKI